MNYNKLRNIMKSKRISQNSLASVLNISTAGVSHLFTRGDMNVSQLETICKYLEISPAILFDDIIEVDSYNILEMLKNENNMLKQQLADKQKIIELLEKKK